MNITFEQYLKDYTAEFGPKTSHERCLVQMMSHASWKLERLQVIEAKLLDLVIKGIANCCERQTLTSIQRYTAAAERTYYRAFHEFQAGRKADAKAESQALHDQVEALGKTPTPGLNHKSESQPVAPKTVNAPRRL